MLFGRDAERGRLAALVDDARGGRAGALVVHGDAGSGKSALLDDAVASAADARVLRTQGLESESPLAFAALHRLLRPIRSLVDRLPRPQGRALRVAFGEEEGAAVDPFLVALAVLSVLTEAAEEGPVLCVVDDAHWLDHASADALLFVARRLQADRVALIFAVRDEEGRVFPHDGVPGLCLQGLAPSAARALLLDRAGSGLSDEVCRQLLAQAGGNALALVEMPSALTPEQLKGTETLPARPHLTAAMERVFLDRCRRLPQAVQTLLLVAAADDSGSVATVRRAAARLGVGPDVLGEAERAGLVVTEEDTVRVRHPLVRSAVYQAATGLERREAHRALADALDEASDEDRRAWHRAAAAEGPDEGVAASLADAAVRAERRGGYVAASAAFERAAQLSANDRGRAAHLFAAARNAWACGQPARSRSLAEAARDIADDRVLRADIDRLRGRIAYNVGSAADGHRILMQATRAVAADDPVRALEMASVATVLAVYGGGSGVSLDPTVVSTAADPADPPHARCLKQLLVGLADADAGDWAAAAGPLREAMRLGVPLGNPDLLANLGAAALYVGDDAAARRCFTELVSDGRVSGAGMVVLYALQRLMFVQLLAGEWTAVLTSASEARALGAAVGQRPLMAVPLAMLGLVDVRQGTGKHEDLLAEALQIAAECELGILTGPVADVVSWAKGTRAVQDGDSGAALHQFDRIRVPAIQRMAAVDRLDAAVRAGDRVRAGAWTAELADFATGTQWAWALAAADHGRALLADTSDAPALFASAAVHHDGGGRPYDRARTHLAYGEFLRRNHQRVEARGHLRLALEIFEDLGARPLAERATQELRASGETARKRDASTLVELTSTELQIAQLVAQGLSNKEVAGQCWISPRTVEFHLRNCFTKTGVTSRGELTSLLRTQPA